MSCETDEDVLHFFVNYNFFTLKESNKEYMEEIDYDSIVKDE